MANDLLLWPILYTKHHFLDIPPGAFKGWDRFCHAVHPPVFATLGLMKVRE